MSGKIPFKYFEVQRFNQWWLWGLILITTVLAWWTFIEQIIYGRPVGTNPGPDIIVWAVFILFGLGLPLLLILMKLKIRIDHEYIHIRLAPIPGRKIKLSEITRAEARTYRPIMEYGGWGIRWSPGNGKAYNAYGNRGVQLELESGEKILLGSQQPEKLAAVINDNR